MDDRGDATLTMVGYVVEVRGVGKDTSGTEGLARSAKIAGVLTAQHGWSGFCENQKDGDGKKRWPALKTGPTLGCGVRPCCFDRATPQILTEMSRLVWQRERWFGDEMKEGDRKRVPSSGDIATTVARRAGGRAELQFAGSLHHEALCQERVYGVRADSAEALPATNQRAPQYTSRVQRLVLAAA
ncbi:hypothetical protein OPT61_g5955 [Boeremia exigua]|uniref:Uncharacterized protein n=1 Tax=Boeremia exigua TaxID=749465 RepID=A0ACC2I8G2_9PLEO|nr:hypothetical protein OPT61_g5955 [Boeremia exigua]